MNPIEEFVAAVIARGFVGETPPRPYSVAREVIEAAPERTGLGVGNGLASGLGSASPASEAPPERDPLWIIVDADGNSILDALRGFGGSRTPHLMAVALCDALNHHQEER